MVWKIELDRDAKRGLDKLDRQTADRILNFLYERVAPLKNPRQIGEALQGSRLGSYWKYRVGDNRIIANIVDKKVLIIVVRIGNRRDIYKR